MLEKYGQCGGYQNFSIQYFAYCIKLILDTRYPIPDTEFVRLLSEIDVSGRRVFVRADLDVPLREAQVTKGERLTTNAELEVFTRLTNLKPTVDYLLQHGASQIVIAGHIDRPLATCVMEDGKPENYDPAKSTKQLLETLQNILGRDIEFTQDVIANEMKQSRDRHANKKVFLLENLRFWPGEVANDLEFAKRLAALADIYVNEAFGNCHRNHASMVVLPGILPAAAGLHLEQEVNVLSNLLSAPQRPFIALVGGVKIETKVPVVENLAKVADKVLVGGELPIEIARTGQKFAENVLVGVLTGDTTELSQESTKLFIENVKNAKTIVWNGPLGLIEKGFTKATTEVAKAICESEAYSVVGGGDTTHFLESNDLLSKFSFVSAGGGAMLEFLSGKKLPGIKALE